MLFRQHDLYETGRSTRVSFPVGFSCIASAGKEVEIREEKEHGLEPPTEGPDRAPSVLTWPFRRLWWAIEERLIWPVSDFLAGKEGRRARTHAEAPPPGPSRRHPLAWVGATALAMVAIGATAAAVFFYSEAEDSSSERVVVRTADPRTVIVPMEPAASDEPTLEGVAPKFEAAAGRDGKDSGKLPANAVAPAPEPKEPAMEAAHRFATAFSAWEVGRKGALGTIKETTTRRLGRELAARPPRLPEGVEVPRARVLNVVEGKSTGDRTEASVSLLRAGSASELRLLLKQEGKGRKAVWLVTEVKG